MKTFSEILIGLGVLCLISGIFTLTGGLATTGLIMILVGAGIGSQVKD